MSASAAVWASAVVTVALVLLHAAVPHVRRLPHVSQRAIGSLAGGVAVSYVFLHLLPELAQGGEELSEALEEAFEATPLVELAIFFVALAGFVVLYGLERLAVHSGSGRAPGRIATAGDPHIGIYRLHLGSFALYNGLITYTMPLRFRTGAAFAVLFAVAMGLHFVLTDRGLAEHYPRRFARNGRLLLAAALVAGWLVAATTPPAGTLVVTLLTALLAGGILLNVFKEELPSADRSSFTWFLSGAGLYTALLTLVTLLAA